MEKKIKVGFDLGSRCLKVAALKKGVIECHELLLPENLMQEDTVAMEHAFSAFLKKVKKDLGLPGGPAGLILPSSQVICRMVTLPRMSVDQLMLNLPYEFSDFIRGETHLYHCDYAVCRPQADSDREDELTMMAAVAEKQTIQAYVRMFAAGGFSLKLMLPQEMALLQLARSRSGGEDGEYCFMDLGYLATRIFIVRGDRLLTTRRIPIGSRDLDVVAADLLNVDPFLCDAYKRSNHQDILRHPRCVELYEQVAVEALKLINFYHFTNRQNQLQGIHLIGGGAAVEPMRNILEDTLGLPTLPVSELLGSNADNNSTCAGAAGLLLGQL